MLMSLLFNHFILHTFSSNLDSGQRAAISVGEARPSSLQLPPPTPKSTEVLYNYMGKSFQWVPNKSCPDNLSWVLPMTRNGPLLLLAQLLWEGHPVFISPPVLASRTESLPQNFLSASKDPRTSCRPQFDQKNRIVPPAGRKGGCLRQQMLLW